MTLILAFIAAHLGWLVGLFGVAASGLYAYVSKQKSNSVVAQAGQAVAQAQTQVANERASDATANQVAAQAGSTAATDRTAIDADIAAKSPTEVQSEIDQLRQ